MSVEKVKEILNRRPAEKSERAWMSPQTGTEDRPDTFVIKTRDGNVGLLQIVKTNALLQFAMIRYRISETKLQPDGRDYGSRRDAVRRGTRAKCGCPTYPGSTACYAS